MNILTTIMDERRADVDKARAEVSQEALQSQAADRVYHSLIQRLAEGDGTQVIAEVKKASPSAGILVEDYRPAERATVYEVSGAAGISVLTEPNHFMGSAQDLRDVRGAVDLPVLRKDFMCDEYQLFEAAAWGADVVLLIVAALDKVLLRDLYSAAIALGLEVLVESHSADELEIALELENAIIGINSRNLSTLVTDLGVARDLAGRIPGNRLSIAESGIKCRSDIENLEEKGYNGFLVGESLLKVSDSGAELRGFLH